MERKPKGGSDAQFALNSDASTDGDRQVFDDGQPQASPSGFSRTGFVDGVEPFEDTVEILSRNSDTLVDHKQFDSIVVRLGLESDLSSAFGVANRVAQEVSEDGAKGIELGKNDPIGLIGRICELVIDGDLVCLGDGLVFAYDRADEFGQR